MKLYMFWTIPLSIIRGFSLYTQQWYTSYRFADCLWAGSFADSLWAGAFAPVHKLSAKVYDIYHCCVYSEKPWWWTKEWSETCRVSFQNKFEKLVYLVGFIIRIYHDTRSHERKKCPKLDKNSPHFI